MIYTHFASKNKSLEEQLKHPCSNDCRTYTFDLRLDAWLKFTSQYVPKIMI